MKKLNKVAVLFASVALAAPVVAFAQTGADNWRGMDGTVWKNGSNELCWRDAFWTPATANAKCDGALKPPAPAPKPMAPPPPPPAPKAAVVPPPAPAPKPVAAPPKPVMEKIIFGAVPHFNFDKSNLTPSATALLADLVSKTKGVNLEVVIAVGYTDSIGSAAFNQKLSVARAEAVKAYLVKQGIERNRIYTEGKGLNDPVATNKTAAGRADNRRVEVEVVGTRTKK